MAALAPKPLLRFILADVALSKTCLVLLLLMTMGRLSNQAFRLLLGHLSGQYLRQLIWNVEVKTEDVLIYCLIASAKNISRNTSCSIKGRLRAFLARLLASLIAELRANFQVYGVCRAWHTSCLGVLSIFHNTDSSHLLENFQGLTLDARIHIRLVILVVTVLA